LSIDRMVFLKLSRH